MSDAPSASAVTVVAPPAREPRWIPLVTVILAILGLVGVIGGGLLTLGAWRTQVDLSIAELQKRMDTAEGNQRTYIPVLLGLTKDVSYLADRARRQDEREDQARDGERGGR